MKPSQVKEAIRLCYKANKPVFITGPPGVGKSGVINQVAEELKIGMIDERMLQRDVVDVRGFPHLVDGVMKFTRPDYLPVKGKGFLLLDELNAAPPLVQAACYQLVLEGRIGEHKLPKGWLVIAAGNRDIDRAVVSRMPTPLANRFIHIDFEYDLDEWVVWALAKGIRTELIAFLRFRPELLMNFDPKRSGKAFATPRSNETLSRVIDAGNGDIDYELAKGITGEAHATEFMGFLRIYKDLPDPDVALMSPSAVDIPTDPATLYALCGAIASKASDQTFKRMVEFANRLTPEFSVLLIRDAIERDSGLTQTRAFIEWSAVHASVLI